METATAQDLDQLCVNTIRTLSMDAVQKANSGHPGTPMALAPITYVLYTRVMKHNPENPDWFDRDRFVLSAGHASMLLYSMLYLTGYGLELDDLKNFRQLGSPTAGHPEYGHAAGIETTTGPLGQGISNSVGLALAERMWNARLGDIVDHHTYTIASDGDLQEGVASEACSLAGPSRPGPPDRVLRRQPHLDRGRHRRSRSPRTSAGASRPTAGTSRTSARTSTSAGSRPRSRRRSRSPTSRR